MANSEPSIERRQVRFGSSAVPSEDTRVVAIRGVERMNQCFYFDIDLVCRESGGFDEVALLTEPAVLGFERHGVVIRQVHGIISSVRRRGRTDMEWDQYTVRLVPRMHRLTLTETLDIYMDLSIPQIIAKKLSGAGLQPKSDFEFHLMEEYPAQEFVVQYKETDLAFVSRLVEHFGISFFFVHNDDCDKIIFTDDNFAYPKIAGDFVSFDANSAGIRELYSTRKAIPGTYAVRDYNYRLPHVDLLGQASIMSKNPGAIVEYGTHFKTPKEGARFAKIRAEQVFANRLVYAGKGTVEEFSPGLIAEVEGAFEGKVELLITEVNHTVVQDAFRHTEEGLPYTNDFTAIPSKVTYRPPRITPKPRITGVVTGRIDAGKRSQYADVDAEGRYRVTFLFDTAGRGEGLASRPVRMAQPHSGAGYGMHFPLRPETEVILTFIDGDPDRPIIAGTVPNPQTPSPISQGNHTRNIIRTGGNNEINIDDTTGLERIKMTVPHCNTAFQLGAPNTPEQGAALTTQEAWTAAAGSSANTLTSLATVYSEISAISASLEITQFAGAASTVAAAIKASGKISDAIVSVGKNGLESAQKWMAQGQAKLDEAQVVAEGKQRTAEAEKLKIEERDRKEVEQKKADAKAAHDAEQKALEALNAARARGAQPQELSALEADHAAKQQAAARADAAVTAAEKAAATNSAAATKVVEDAKADAEKKKTTAAANKKKLTEESPGVEMRKVADGLNKAKTATGFLAGKGGELLLSKAASIAAKANSLSAKASEATAVAVAGTLGAAGRIPVVTVLPAKPKYFGGGANGATLWAGVTALVHGGATAAVVSPAQAILGGGAKAVVHSPAQAELSGVARCLVSSKAVVDIKSNLKVVMASGAKTTISAKATLLMTSKANMRITTQAQMTVASKSKMTLKAQGDYSLSAPNISAKAKTAYNVEAPQVNFKKGSSFQVDTKKMEIDAQSLRVKAKSKVEMNSKGTTLIDSKGNLTAKGAKITVDAKGPVSISGKGTAKLCGSKVMIG